MGILSLQQFTNGKFISHSLYASIARPSSRGSAEIRIRLLLFVHSHLKMVERPKHK
jgi:hypothetical protein